MHISRRYTMPTVLWTCSTLKRVEFSRGATWVPLLSLEMGVCVRVCARCFSVKNKKNKKNYDREISTIFIDFFPMAKCRVRLIVYARRSVWKRNDVLNIV